MEWSKTQSLAYRDWANHYLAERDIEIADLETGFSDGTTLIHLVEIVSKKSVGRYSTRPRFFGHKVENVQIAIQFIENEWGVKAYGCSPISVLEGNLKQTMGLLFLIINARKDVTDYDIVGDNLSSQKKGSGKAMGEEIGRVAKMIQQIKGNETVESGSENQKTTIVDNLEVSVRNVIKGIKEKIGNVVNGNVTNGENSSGTSSQGDKLDSSVQTSPPVEVDRKIDATTDNESGVIETIERKTGQYFDITELTDLSLPKTSKEYSYVSEASESIDDNIEVIEIEDVNANTDVRDVDLSDILMKKHESEASSDESSIDADPVFEGDISETISDALAFESVNIDIEGDFVSAKERLDSFIKSLKTSKHRKGLIVMVQSILRERYLANTSRELKKWKSRHNVASEIVSTEQSYVRGLDVMVDIYFHYLRAIPENVLDHSSFNSLEGNLVVIRNYNTMFCEELEIRLRNFYSFGERIGDIFKRYSKLFKVYSDYVKEYNSTIVKFSAICREPTIAQVLYKCKTENDMCKNTSLQDFLITPIQRLPRYQLLLQELIKDTPERHPDYSLLQIALSEIINVSQYVDAKITEAQNLSEVISVSSRIQKCPEYLPQPHRKFIRESILLVSKCEPEASVDEAIADLDLKKRTVFCFNDILVITKKRSGFSGKDMVRFLDMVDTSDYEIFYLPSRTHKKYLLFGIKKWFESSIEYLFAPSDAKERDDWIQDIDDSIATKLNARISRIQKGDIGDNPNEVLKEGYLNKQNRKMEWKLKYFVCTTSFLAIYKTEEQYRESQGHPLILDTLEIDIYQWPVSDVQHCMQIKHSDMIIHCHAGSNRSRMNWINSVRSATRKHIELTEENQINITYSVSDKTIGLLKASKTRKKTLFTSFKKTGNVIRKGAGSSVKFETCKLDKNVLTFFDGKQKKLSIDLLLAEPIESNKLKVYKVEAEEVYFFRLKNNEAGRVELIGSTNMSEIQDWIHKINSTILKLRKKSLI